MARETYRKFLALLDPKIANLIELKKDKGKEVDPKIVPKKPHNRMRIRILPKESKIKPSGFWDWEKCFYEILVDPWKQELGSCLGEVEFFCYANQPNGRGKQYIPSVSRILEKVMKIAPPTGLSGFVLVQPNNKCPRFHFQRRY